MEDKRGKNPVIFKSLEKKTIILFFQDVFFTTITLIIIFKRIKIVYDNKSNELGLKIAMLNAPK